MKIKWDDAKRIVNSYDPPYVFATRASQRHPKFLFDGRSDDELCITLSGLKMRDWNEFARVMSDELSITTSWPYNWYAIDDGIENLSRFPQKKILLVIDQGDKVLIHEPKEFQHFISSLVHAGEHWKDPMAYNLSGPYEEPRMFHTVFVLPDRYHGARGLELMRD